ncbi:hypothetical protein GJAV_G00225480 [Gymnothorax javanicus]|nr:hypothetical protein GJAV_G00225480 [Gymnothorax javanicus]
MATLRQAKIYINLVRERQTLKARLGQTPAGTMAVRNRICSSTRPWSFMGPKGYLEGQKGYLEGQKGYFEAQSPLRGQKGEKEMCREEDPSHGGILPLLTRAFTVGTAETMVSHPLSTERLSLFITQPQCDEQPEFSPSCSQRPFIGSPNCLRRTSSENNVAYRTANDERPTRPQPPPSSSRSRRKRQRQKRQRERGGGGVREREGGGGEAEQTEESAPPSVPEQESSGYSCQALSQDEAPEFPSRCISSQSLGVQETERPRWDRTESPQRLPRAQTPTRTPQPWCSPNFPPPGLKISLSSQESLAGLHLSSQDNWPLARFGLRGNVCQEDRVFAAPFFKEVEKEAREEEEEGTEEGSDTNEGLLFHPEEKLQPNDYEYREGRDYSIEEHLGSGSYGDIYSVRDNKTNYKCAAKKIPRSRFNSEEVGSWSALDSPRVLPLYGAVREGQWVILFMPQKSGSVGQMIRDRGYLPEDVALHYISQVSEAAEYLHARGFAHLDIKADNVLLSEDGKETYLSDFGHSERLDRNGWSMNAYPGEGFRGTETHMAPEVAKGERRGAKADVWSVCCMLLHMLTGYLPWTRYYSSPLCLKIANEDPPLREIPSNCNHCTADVVKAGLQKDPIKRASAKELRECATRALMAVGGLTSPVKGTNLEPAKPEPMETRHMSSGPLPSPLAPPSPVPLEKNSSEWGRQNQTSGRRELSNDKAVDEEDSDADWLSSSSRPRPSLHPHSSRQPKGEGPGDCVSAWELEREFFMSSLSQPHSLELQEQLLFCLSSDSSLLREPQDKESEHWSVGHSLNLSSGIFSGSSQPDGLSFEVDWAGSASQPPSRSFEGVDVNIQDYTGRWLRIRESPGVTVGHVARGISDQISLKAFTLETRYGDPVSADEEVLDSGLWLTCIPSPDSGPSWRWRVRDGILEKRE